MLSPQAGLDYGSTRNLAFVAAGAELLNSQLDEKGLVTLEAGDVLVRAYQGRLLIVGSDRAAALDGLARLLTDEPRRIDGTSPPPFIHEWHLTDEPYFQLDVARCEDLNKSSSVGASKTTNPSSAQRQMIAAVVKNSVRSGQRTLPALAIKVAASAIADCELVRRLARNPCANLSQIAELSR